MNEQTNEQSTTQEPGTGLQVIPKSGGMVKTVIGENSENLTSILMDNIKKLQSNPEFLPQAKEIREQVREIVSIAKVQVDMFRITKE